MVEFHQFNTKDYVLRTYIEIFDKDSYKILDSIEKSRPRWRINKNDIKKASKLRLGDRVKINSPFFNTSGTIVKVLCEPFVSILEIPGQVSYAGTYIHVYGSFLVEYENSFKSLRGQILKKCL